MEYEKEFIGKITGMGMLGYDVQKIINILDIEDSENFKEEFSNEDSQIRIAYQRGLDKSDYILDQKLYEQAKSGDIESIKLFEKRKIDRICRNIND